MKGILHIELLLEYVCRNSKDILLAGPYIQFQKLETEINSFNNFTLFNKFKILEYNDVEIVSKNITHIDRKEFELGNIKYRLDNGTSSLQDKVIQTIVKIEDNTLIYCGRKSEVERLANYLSENDKYLSFISEKHYNEDDKLFSIFLDHVETPSDMIGFYIEHLKRESEFIMQGYQNIFRMN